MNTTLHIVLTAIIISNIYSAKASTDEQCKRNSGVWMVAAALIGLYEYFK